MKLCDYCSIIHPEIECPLCEAVKHIENLAKIIYDHKCPGEEETK